MISLFLSDKHRQCNYCTTITGSYQLRKDDEILIWANGRFVDAVVTKVVHQIDQCGEMNSTIFAEKTDD